MNKTVENYLLEGCGRCSFGGTRDCKVHSLTPGRQRGYILYFSAPKQAKTRVARIEKCIGKILNGEGLHDKYGRKKKRDERL